MFHFISKQAYASLKQTEILAASSAELVMEGKERGRRKGRWWRGREGEAQRDKAIGGREKKMKRQGE